MKKSEIMEKLREIYSEIDEMEDNLNGAKLNAKKVKSLLEDIPDEEDEFCDNSNSSDSGSD